MWLEPRHTGLVVQRDDKPIDKATQMLLCVFETWKSKATLQLTTFVATHTPPQHHPDAGQTRNVDRKASGTPQPPDVILPDLPKSPNIPSTSPRQPSIPASIPYSLKPTSPASLAFLHHRHPANLTFQNGPLLGVAPCGKSRSPKTNQRQFEIEATRRQIQVHHSQG